MISPEGIGVIRHYEGFRQDPYLCPGGVWTIGFGSTRGVTADSPSITEAGAEALLRHDLARYERAVERLTIPVISDGQFAALVSFAFNLGSGAYRSSTLRRRVNRSEWADVPRQFRRWVIGGGQRLEGLVRRREAEIQLWISASP